MIRKARAVWRGTGKDGKGELTTIPACSRRRPTRSRPDSRARRARTQRSGLRRRMPAASPWRSPSSSRAPVTPTELSTEAAVSLDKDGQGFTITKSALTLRAEVPGIERAKFEELPA